MYELLYIFVYSIVFSNGVRKATGDGLNVIAALLFGVVGTFGTTILLAAGLNIAGYLGLCLGAIASCFH